MSELTSKVLSSLADMADFAPHWRTMDEASTAHFVWFQSYSWCFTWMQNYGNSKTRPYVIVVFEGQSPIAILPLMIHVNSVGLCSARILGEPHSQYANVLTLHDVASPKLAKTLADAVSKIPKIDLLSLSLVPEDSALAQVLAQLPHKLLDGNFSAQVDLQPSHAHNFENSQLANPSSRFLRKATKEIGKFGEISLEVLRPSDVGYEQRIQLCISQKLDWLKNTGRFSRGLHSKNLVVFLTGVYFESSTSTSPLVFALRAGSEIVALEIGFLQRNHYYACIGSFDWRLRDHSPGRLQMHHTMNWLTSQGVETYDLLGMISPYKTQSASRTTRLLHINKANNWRGFLFATIWLGWGKPRIKNFLGKTPKLVRGLSHLLGPSSKNYQ